MGGLDKNLDLLFPHQGFVLGDNISPKFPLFIPGVSETFNKINPGLMNEGDGEAEEHN